MTEKAKTSFEIAAERMLSEGAERVEAGTTVPLRPDVHVRLITGWGAWNREKGKLVCTGQVKTSATGEGVSVVLGQLRLA